VTLTASMGASLFPNDATEVAGLLGLAETALEAAKLEGGIASACRRIRYDALPRAIPSWP
jgi:GGDEF domain-containing protein